MNIEEIINKVKPEFEKAFNFFKSEIEKIQTSRPSFSLIEDLKVDFFDHKYLLKQLASVSKGKEREIIIEPWDKSYISSIEKAIQENLPSYSVSTRENKIFLSIPPLSQEYRKDLLRELALKRENAKQTIRHWRKTCWDKIQQLYQDKEISEDEKFKAKDKLQEIVDEYNEKIEKLTSEKEKEIQTE